MIFEFFFTPLTRLLPLQLRLLPLYHDAYKTTQLLPPVWNGYLNCARITTTSRGRYAATLPPTPSYSPTPSTIPTPSYRTIPTPTRPKPPTTPGLLLLHLLISYLLLPTLLSYASYRYAWPGSQCSGIFFHVHMRFDHII